MKNIRKRSKRNLLIGFGFTLVILIISSVLSYISIEQLLNSQKWVDHTVQVETGLDNLISRMKDAETGQRGFLLTNDESFLEPYTGAKSDVAELLTNIQLLTRDNPIQQREMPHLETLIKHKFDLIGNSIVDKKRGIPPTSAMLLQGKSVMDSIRRTITNMVNREKKLMITRNAEMDKFATYTPVIVGIASFIAMIISIVFYFRVRRDARLAADLQNELVVKEANKLKQITTIGNVAEKIAKGDYNIRLDKTDLE
ncbi:CHASE3 domain-containing protein [Pedobacter sp. PWIIR3]